MSPVFFKPRHIPHVRRPLNAPLPNYKGLFIGINYEWNHDGSGPGDDKFKLKGPINDAKAMRKAVMEFYKYREQDCFLMTDEKCNKGTEMWPSVPNILRAIDNLVRGASPGDVFVFYYAGHCAHEWSVNNNVEERQTYILGCDLDKIFDYTLRKRLVDPLPKGARLTAITDACYSGPLLALDHYRCHHFLRRRCQSLSTRRKSHTKVLRRHTEAAAHLFLAQSTAFLRRRFSSVVTTTLAFIRLKNRLAKRSKSKKPECGNESRSPTPPPISPVLAPISPILTPVSPIPTPISPIPSLVHCSFCNRDYDPLDAPDVISLSPCTEDQRTWEDSRRKGTGMTAKLIKILKKDPSIKLDVLNKQINKCLSKLSFKRVRKATAAFRRLGELVTPGRKAELEDEFRDRGLFDLNEQTAQFGSLRRLRPDDQFIYERDWAD